MSNCDHTIDDGFEALLREDPGEISGGYAGRNFYAYVWFDDSLFQAEVWVHQSLQETIPAATLKELMETVSDNYGWD